MSEDKNQDSNVIVEHKWGGGTVIQRTGGVENEPENRGNLNRAAQINSGTLEYNTGSGELTQHGTMTHNAGDLEPGQSGLLTETMRDRNMRPVNDITNIDPDTATIEYGGTRMNVATAVRLG